MALDKMIISVTHNISNGSGNITRIDTAGNAHPFYLGPPLNNPGVSTLMNWASCTVPILTISNIIAISLPDRLLFSHHSGFGTWRASIKYYIQDYYMSISLSTMVFKVDTVGQVVFCGIWYRWSSEGHVKPGFHSGWPLSFSDVEILWWPKAWLHYLYFQK
ncbi:MAG: hypothetical protein IPJ54_10050 [Saprospiraceae bacterium]|nr:hypothetical protein [Saprospiraceae bacterium]